MGVASCGGGQYIVVIHGVGDLLADFSHLSMTG